VQLRGAVVHADKVAVREASTAASCAGHSDGRLRELEAAWSHGCSPGVTRRDAIVAAKGRELEEAALAAAASRGNSTT
jgi:hypothetical protein